MPSRNAVNFVLDTCLLLTLTSLLASAAIVQVVFPPASRAAGWTLWGKNLDFWMQVQGFITAALALGVLIHLILHWTWVCGFLAGRLSKRLGRRVHVQEAAVTVYGVATLIFVLTLLTILVGAATFAIESPPPSS